MGISISFAIAPEDAVALEALARRVVGPRHSYVSYDAEGDYTLDLQFDDIENHVQGRERGIETWNQLLADGRMPAAEPTILGVSRYSVTEAPEWRFITDAEDFLGEHRHEMAVVAAQIACEVVARTVLERLNLVRREHMPVPPDKFRQPRWHLRDPGMQLLFFTATGTRIQDFPDWARYETHVKRRNNVVHKGAAVTRAEAQMSVEVAWEFIYYVERAAAPHLGPPNYPRL